MQESSHTSGVCSSLRCQVIIVAAGLWWVLQGGRSRGSGLQPGSRRAERAGSWVRVCFGGGADWTAGRLKRVWGKRWERQLFGRVARSVETPLPQTERPTGMNGAGVGGGLTAASGVLSPPSSADEGRWRSLGLRLASPGPLARA